MANIIDMPKLSDTMTVGTLVKWLKKEGDAVKSGDMLAEVETDKATMELESFFDGTLLKIFAAGGSQVAIGDPLCAVGKAGEQVDTPAAKDPTPPPVSEPSEAKSTSGEGAPTTSKKEVEARPAAAQAPTPAAPAAAPAANGSASTAVAAPSNGSSNGRIKISPLARKLAEEKRIDPATVTGSGPGGRIVRADILAAEKNPRPAAKAPAGNFSGGSPSRTGPIQEERVVPVSNMRGVIARRLIEAKTQIPHFYLDIEVDADPLLALRAQLNTGLEKEGVKLSVNDFILKATAEALRRVPAANASWEGTAIHYFASAHVSFAVAIEDGLITPVIKDTHAKSVFAISTEAKALGKRARDRKLSPAEYTGGTFCVSNLGMMGITKFNAIINPPNAGILAVGTTVTKPVVKNGQIVIGNTMMLTLSCDHRVVDGAVGAQFLSALKQLVEAPGLLLV
ncbi:MAG: pyruvate dehydrogenase complex dihydrolipoamide acetyltransferase [Opitutus sp.]